MRKMTSLCAALAIGAGVIGAAAVPEAAQAAPSGNTVQGSGASQAVVVQPAAVTNITAIRFGQFVQPTSAGTLVLTPAGGLTASGGVAGNQLITQTGGGAGPGTFQIVASINQGFVVYGPITTLLANGAASMTLTNLTGALSSPTNSLSTSTYVLSVGGTLNVSANQALGTYTGSYTITTYYM